MIAKQHWNDIYVKNTSSEISWFQQHAKLSLQLITSTNIDASASIIDVGGGMSPLACDLVEQGFTNISIMDLSNAALKRSQAHLGKNALKINWIEANILEYDLPSYAYDIWHDRAVFHFLTTKNQRDVYIKKVSSALKPGGHIVIATFAEDGPKQCSGLPVMRYNVEQLQQQFGESFRLMQNLQESHITPDGIEQKFIYCLYKLNI